MKAMLASRAHDRISLKIKAPRASLDSEGKQRVDNDGLPIFENQKVSEHLAELYTISIRRCFVEEYRFIPSNRLSQSVIDVFMYLAFLCSWSETRVVIDAKTNKPVAVSTDGAWVQAVIIQLGNKTHTRSLRKIVETTGHNEKTVRDALKQLEAKNIIKPIDLYDPYVQKHSTKRRGKPAKFVRYEMNPRYVWCGPVLDGLDYLENDLFNQRQSHESQ